MVSFESNYLFLRWEEGREMNIVDRFGKSGTLESGGLSAAT